MASEECFGRRQECGSDSGGIPLFTEGFSILVHRVQDLLYIGSQIEGRGQRKLPDGQPEQPKIIVGEDSPSEEQRTHLEELRGTLSKWAPYLNLNSPTVTFPGTNIVCPRLEEPMAVLETQDGWIPGPEIPKN